MVWCDEVRWRVLGYTDWLVHFIRPVLSYPPLPSSLYFIVCSMTATTLSHASFCCQFDLSFMSPFSLTSHFPLSSLLNFSRAIASSLSLCLSVSLSLCLSLPSSPSFPPPRPSPRTRTSDGCLNCTVIDAVPGIIDAVPGVTLIVPTVQTASRSPPPPPPMRRPANRASSSLMKLTADMHASLRSNIRVVPAWFCPPSNAILYWRRPTIEETTPTLSPDPSSRCPCSM